MTPAQQAAERYVIYTGEEDIWCDSLEEAREQANKAIDDWREMSVRDGEWPQEVEQVRICKVIAEVEGEWDDDGEPQGQSYVSYSLKETADSATTPYKQRIAELEAAIETIRDSVLHERHQLAEAGLDCDQVNAVLGIIDDEYHPKEPTE